MQHAAHRSAQPVHVNHRWSRRALIVLAGGASTLVLAMGSSAMADDPVSDNLDPQGPRLTCQGEIPTIVAGRTEIEVVGTAGDDVIVASGADHKVHAEGGDDLICTDHHQGGNGDLVVGGSGNDRIYTGSGDDNIQGSAGSDMMSSGGGNDVLLGSDGNDGAYGGSGLDWCYNAEAHSCGRLIRR